MKKSVPFIMIMPPVQLYVEFNYKEFEHFWFGPSSNTMFATSIGFIKI